MLIHNLTLRELQCVKLMAGHCLPHKQVADRLNVSKAVVDCELMTARRKLGVTNQAELIHWALANGVVENRFERRPMT